MKRPHLDHGASADERELLFFRRRGCDATGYQTQEGMWVLAESKGRPELLPSARDGIRKERKALQRLNVISVDEHELVFLKDHLFDSPSDAGRALYGGEVNGKAYWRNANGQSINDLERFPWRRISSRTNRDDSTS
jgi:Domain of unknown function (DUF4357)